MKPEDFREALEALELAVSSDAAAVLDVSPAKVREWRTGHRVPPRYIVAHLESLAYLQVYRPDRFKELVGRKLKRAGRSR